MVYLAVLNLGLIGFDLTYLWLRPTYFSMVPAVTRLYDPIKGIEPHPVTDQYLRAAGDLGLLLSGESLPIVDDKETRSPEALWRELRYAGVADSSISLESGRWWSGRQVGDSGTERGPLGVERVLGELRTLSLRMMESDPFGRSGQSRSLVVIGVGMEVHLEAEGGAPESMSPPEVVDRFWSWDPDHLEDRLTFFEADLAPLMAVNFDRQFDLGGDFVDHFWWIDLPFLLLFTVEFFTRWVLAMRRKEYARWFLFPIINWYDLLGIIPLKQFRVFRLFRIGSIYVRLRRSDRTVVGDDFISRTVEYFSNIITEEISDMVSLRILNETQDEVRHGTHRKIIRTVMESHRDTLVAELTVRIGEALSSAPIRERARTFLDANLERAVASSDTLRRLPVPDRLLRPLVETVGQAVFESIADTLQATVEDDEGREALEAIVGEAVDRLVEELVDGELEVLVRSISLEVIEHIKGAVSVRKWALSTEEAARYEGARIGEVENERAPSA